MLWYALGGSLAQFSVLLQNLEHCKHLYYIKNWTVYVQDRTKWKKVVEKAKTFNKRS